MLAMVKLSTVLGTTFMHGNGLGRSWTNLRFLVTLQLLHHGILLFLAFSGVMWMLLFGRVNGSQVMVCALETTKGGSLLLKEKCL